MQRLLERAAPLAAACEDADGRTPLCLAIDYGDVDTVRCLAASRDRAALGAYAAAAGMRSLVERAARHVARVRLSGPRGRRRRRGPAHRSQQRRAFWSQ